MEKVPNEEKKDPNVVRGTEAQIVLPYSQRKAAPPPKSWWAITQPLP